MYFQYRKHCFFAENFSILNEIRRGIESQKAKTKYRKKPKQNTTKSKSKMPQKAKIILLIQLLLATLLRKINKRVL